MSDEWEIREENGKQVWRRKDDPRFDAWYYEFRDPKGIWCRSHHKHFFRTHEDVVSFLKEGTHKAQGFIKFEEIAPGEYIFEYRGGTRCYRIVKNE